MAGVALVTGAAVRIGRAIAEALAKDGWTVAIHHHNSAREAADLVHEITKSGGKAAAFTADLSDEDQVQALIRATSEQLGALSCLVNSASVFDRDDIRTATAESWGRHIGINLRAPFVLTQGFVEQLPDHLSGNIINILDQRVWNLTPHFTSYTLSKAALWTLTQTSAMALAPQIRVNAIGPGPTLPSQRQSEDEFERQVQSTLLSRAVGVQEIGETVRFILASPSLTGQMIALDAGQHLGGAWSKTVE